MLISADCEQNICFALLRLALITSRDCSENPSKFNNLGLLGNLGATIGANDFFSKTVIECWRLQRKARPNAQKETRNTTCSNFHLRSNTQSEPASKKAEEDTPFCFLVCEVKAHVGKFVWAYICTWSLILQRATPRSCNRKQNRNEITSWSGKLG